jgi:hypothetical protein
MTLKRRIDRLERGSPTVYGAVTEVPTPELKAVLGQAYRAGEWPRTPEDQALFSELKNCGHEFEACFAIRALLMNAPD